jgi:methionyl aminopeptidase
MLPWVIEVKSESEIEKMRAAARAAREVLDIAGQAVRAGVSTDEIDALVHEETVKVSLPARE